MQAQDIAAPPATEDAIRVAPEPATPRALWPTFMRRTLAEDTLRELPPRPNYPPNG